MFEINFILIELLRTQFLFHHGEAGHSGVDCKNDKCMLISYSNVLNKYACFPKLHCSAFEDHCSAVFKLVVKL